MLRICAVFAIPGVFSAGILGGTLRPGYDGTYGFGVASSFAQEVDPFALKVTSGEVKLQQVENGQRDLQNQVSGLRNQLDGISAQLNQIQQQQQQRAEQQAAQPIVNPDGTISTPDSSGSAEAEAEKPPKDPFELIPITTDPFALEFVLCNGERAMFRDPTTRQAVWVTAEEALLNPVVYNAGGCGSAKPDPAKKPMPYSPPVPVVAPTAPVASPPPAPPQ